MACCACLDFEEADPLSSAGGRTGAARSTKQYAAPTLGVKATIVSADEKTGLFSLEVEMPNVTSPTAPFAARLSVHVTWASFAALRVPPMVTWSDAPAEMALVTVTDAGPAVWREY